ncbi:MAG: hypothetical protein FWF95_02370 [Syntrophorhabdaceae bacterium]|nr:hypothetical protein [Syntrophorhabdaceae bacterium]
MTIGISLTRDQLLAVVLGGAASFSDPAIAISVRCREPFEWKEEAVTLVDRLREVLPDGVLPGAVITLPPAMTYLRPIKLPVNDLRRARLIHLGELEGNLPIEDDDILSDLLPSSPATPGTFIAVAAKRPLIEKTVETFQNVGIRVDMVITDHAAMLVAAFDEIREDALLVSAFSDILLLRVSNGGVRAARQFPIAMADAPDDILEAIADMTRDKGPATPLVVAGELPASIEKNLSGYMTLSLPEYIPSSHFAAFGAALAPVSQKTLGGFSLRTSAEATANKVREARKIKIAAAAAAASAIFAIITLQFFVWVTGQKLEKIRNQIRSEFSQIAPDVTLRNATMADQIKERITSLDRLRKDLGINAPPPADLLALASSALPRGNIAVRETSIEGGRVRIAGETEDSRLVELFREELSKSFGSEYNATLQGTEASARGSIKFTIQIEQKEDPRAS